MKNVSQPTIQNCFAHYGFYDYQQAEEGLISEECLVVAATDCSRAVDR